MEYTRIPPACQTMGYIEADTFTSPFYVEMWIRSAGSPGVRLAEEVEGWSEAKGRCCETEGREASRRSKAQGLDRSGTLGAEKRHARTGGGIGVYRACRFGAEC